MWLSIEEYARTIVTTPQTVRALMSLYSNGFPCVWVGINLSAMHVAALRAELEEAHGTDTTRYDVEQAQCHLPSASRTGKFPAWAAA
jgi:hypothetical protein